MTFLTAVSAAELRSDESARLWALISYLAEHPDAELDERLTAFKLVYFYDAEVLNGGHLQYFQNRGAAQAASVVNALKVIGAPERALLLEEAIGVLTGSPLRRAESLEGYAELAQHSPYGRLDSKYYDLKPDVLDLLEEYVRPQLPALVAVTQDA